MPMTRLNPQAYKLLITEVDRQYKVSNLEIQRNIVVQRLDKLAAQPGTPASQAEIQQAIADMFPNFDQEVLKKAARVNQNNGKLPKLALMGAITMAGLLGLSGMIWLVNLPFPMIRRPLAKSAPLLLLPSYISMDRNYREAIAHVEQADQLVNQATSAADIDLGAQKVKLAQANLDQLPVWFLGYEPIAVCQFMGCSWHFTFDEFSRARAQVGRMEAKIFQEQNALTQLQSAEENIQQAKQAYQSALAPPQKQEAIANWKINLDRLSQLPPHTLAGDMAERQLASYAPEFREISGSIAGIAQTQTLIAAAQQFAHRAVSQGQKPTLTVHEWEQAAILWQAAINRLEKVEPADPNYLAAQTYLADYTQQLGNVQTRREEESSSVEDLRRAKGQIQALLGSVSAQPSPEERDRLQIQLQGIIEQLSLVKPHTTAYAEAQTLLQQAKAKIAQF